MSDARRLVAVAIDRHGKVAGHAGRAHHWQVYDIWPGEAPESVYRLALAPCQRDCRTRSRAVAARAIGIHERGLAEAWIMRAAARP